MFFERPNLAPKTLKRKDRYSLGELIRSITTLTAVGDDDKLTDEGQAQGSYRSTEAELTYNWEIATNYWQLTAPTTTY